MTDQIEADRKQTPSKLMGVLVRVVRFPLTRIVIALVAVAGALIGVQALLNALGGGLPEAGQTWLGVLLGVGVVHGVYVGYVRLVERRPVREMAFEGAPAELGLGALIGAGVMAVSVAILWIGGFYQVEAVRLPAAISDILALSVQAGYIEEVIFRAIIFRITEEGLGSWWALAISSALFGLAHIGNANATWLSSAAIMIEAGILLGALYMLTRRLWAVVGTHFAWNFTQGGVFGVAVSGSQVDGILQSRLTGPELITGGEFGIEASALAVVLCVAVAAVVLRVAIRRGHVAPPFWRRASRASTDQGSA